MPILYLTNQTCSPKENKSNSYFAEFALGHLYSKGLLENIKKKIKNSSSFMQHDFTDIDYLSDILIGKTVCKFFKNFSMQNFDKEKCE